MSDFWYGALMGCSVGMAVATAAYQRILTQARTNNDQIWELHDRWKALAMSRAAQSSAATQEGDK